MPSCLVSRQSWRGFLPPGNVSHAVLWKNGEVTDLGTLHGDRFSNAYAINSQGQVVGESCPQSCENHLHDRAVLWENGSIFELNSLITNRHSGLKLTIAFAINDRGEIAGAFAINDRGEIAGIPRFSMAKGRHC